MSDTQVPAAPLLALDLVQSVVEGMVVIDAKGQVMFFSRGAERISGWTVEEALGKSINELFPLAVGEEGLLERVTGQGSLPPVNVLNRHGQEVTLAVTCSSLITEEGPASGKTVLVFRDVTEEDAAQRVRSYFLANISHEFRTPLSALKASVELLLDEVGDLPSAETVELVKSLHLSVTRLQTLIDNLLESVSIEAGRFRIRRRPTDLGALIVEAENLMKPLLERKHQSLVARISDGIPPASVDPMRVTEVLVNLLSNASKYGPMDRPIELDVKMEGEKEIRISVSDRGSGIPVDEQASVFRRFVRLDEKDKAQYGIGLGLSVVKTIVEGHGGRVGLEQRSGGGSIFWFTLPLGEE